LKKLKHHITIDTLPIANWQKCKEGKFQYLYKCDFFEVPKKFPPSFAKIFEQMFYEFDHIDLTLPRLLNYAAKCDNKFAVTKNVEWKRRAKKTIYEYTRLLEINKEKASKQSFMDQVGMLSRWIKMQIDIYTLSTRIYHNHLNAYDEYCKYLEKQRRR